jgi:hypothetical protein
MLGSLSLPFSALELRDAVRSTRRYDAARLDRVLHLDESRNLVEVQASTPWIRLASYLRAASVNITQAWDRFPTIGHSVATNAPGPDGRPMVAHVEALALVTPDAELRRISRHSSPELFALVVGGQDMFGAVYSITLRVDSLAKAAMDAIPCATLELAPEKPHGRPLELMVPPDAVEGFIAEARRCCDGWHTAIDSLDVRKSLAEKETVLCWARQEYACVTLGLSARDTLGASVRTTQLRQELIGCAIARGGSFAIACTPDATRDQAEACYPMLKTVLAEKRRLDPMEKIGNPWYRHYRSLLIREACAVRWGN